ncbi:hypothetical protein D3C72_1062410 [compost metagenome]
MEDMKASQHVFAKIVEKLEELRTVVRDDNAVERITQEVAGALNAINHAGVKSDEALAENLRATLMPLVEAVVASNDMHKTLAASIESSNRRIETAHAQLVEELVGKIELISNPQMLPLPIGSEVSGPSLESIADATLALDIVPAADARTA